LCKLSKADTVSDDSPGNESTVLYCTALFNIIECLSRDGLGTVAEDKLRETLPTLDKSGEVTSKGAIAAGGRFLYYPEGKIQEFDAAESEWPMFYAYMVIDGVFKHNDEQVENYHQLLKKWLSFDENGDPILPQFFYNERPDLTRKSQSSHHHRRHHYRAANSDGSNLHLWSQSLLIISDLLTSHRLEPAELDPIRR